MSVGRNIQKRRRARKAKQARYELHKDDWCSDESMARHARRNARRRRDYGVDTYGRKVGTATHSIMGCPAWQWSDGTIQQREEPKPRKPPRLRDRRSGIAKAFLLP